MGQWLILLFILLSLTYTNMSTTNKNSDKIIAHLGTDSTTVAALNKLFPNAKVGEEVHCDKEYYTKTATGWTITKINS